MPASRKRTRAASPGSCLDQNEKEGEVARSTTGRFYHAHPRADWPAAEWRPGGRVASRRRRRDVPPVDVSPRRRLSRDGGGECRRCRGATSRARVAPITVRMEQLAQFVSKSFDNAAAAVAAATSVEAAAGCRATAGGRITLSVAHLIGDHVADDGDRRTCNNLFQYTVIMSIFRCQVNWRPDRRNSAVRTNFSVGSQ